MTRRRKWNIDAVGVRAKYAIKDWVFVLIVGFISQAICYISILQMSVVRKYVFNEHVC